MLLNGLPLELGDDGSIPALNPVPAADNLPVYLAPTSIVFVVLQRFEVKACSRRKHHVALVYPTRTFLFIYFIL
jgi:hypothetical protein